MAPAVPLDEPSILELALTLAKRVLLHPMTTKAGLALLAAVLLARLTTRRRKLSGKTVVLTGGATGLGRAQAFQLAREGCKLIIWDINIEALEQTAADVRAKVPNAQVFPYKVNLVNRSEVYELASKVRREHGPVWGLINNAGILSGSYLLETDDKKIELTMGVNAMAHFWTTKAFLPDMLDANDGAIVGIASAAGYFPSARMVVRLVLLAALFFPPLPTTTTTTTQYNALTSTYHNFPPPPTPHPPI